MTEPTKCYELKELNSLNTFYIKGVTENILKCGCSEKLQPGFVTQNGDNVLAVSDGNKALKKLSWKAFEHSM